MTVDPLDLIRQRDARAAESPNFPCDLCEADRRALLVAHDALAAQLASARDEIEALKRDVQLMIGTAEVCHDAALLCARQRDEARADRDTWRRSSLRYEADARRLLAQIPRSGT